MSVCHISKVFFKFSIVGALRDLYSELEKNFKYTSYMYMTTLLGFWNISQLFFCRMSYKKFRRHRAGCAGANEDPDINWLGLFVWKHVSKFFFLIRLYYLRFHMYGEIHHTSETSMAHMANKCNLHCRWTCWPHEMAWNIR